MLLLPELPQFASATALVCFTLTIATMLLRRYLSRHIISYRYRTCRDADGVSFFVGLPFVGCLDWSTRRNQFIDECLALIPGNIMRLKTTQNVSDEDAWESKTHNALFIAA